VYWSNGDLNVNKSFLNNISDVNFKKKQMNRILEMEKFVNNNGCRMKYITKYFGEDISNCNHCDYCLSNKDEIKIDITNESYQIIKTVKLLKYSFGTSMISEILFGSDSKKLKSEYKKISTYGKLKHVKKDRIKEIIRFLIINSYLIEEKLDRSFGSVIKITNKGTNFVSVSLDEVIDNIFEVKINESKSESLDDNKKLEDKIKKFRIEMSKLEGCKLYQVLSNNTIDLLSSTKIESLNDLRKINGIGDKKIEKYGDKLLELIQS
jgi:ATP-dependent DNA helicase RecQ